MVLRAIESGIGQEAPAARASCRYRADDLGQSIRGVPVLGTFADLDQVVQDFQERGVPIRRLVATPSALAPEAHPDMLIARARRLGLPLSRVTSLGEGMRDAELAPLEIEDLLLRPTVQIDRARLERFIDGKRVLVTGGGGSIGSEICTARRGLRRERSSGPRELRAVPATTSSKTPRSCPSDTQDRRRDRRCARPRAGRAR